MCRKIHDRWAIMKNSSAQKILWEKIRMFSLAWTHLTSLWPKFDHYSFTFHLWNKLMLNFHLNALFIIRFHIKYSSSVFQKWDLLILESLLVLLWHSGLISIQKILAVFTMLMIATVWMETAALIKRCVVSRNAFSALSSFFLKNTNFSCKKHHTETLWHFLWTWNICRWVK